MINSYLKTADGQENITAYRWNEGVLPRLRFEEQTKKKTRTKYAVEFATLDTETSHEGLETGWVYQWAVNLSGVYFYGRTPSELINLLSRLRDEYNLTDDKRLVVYVHNLSYDWQYMKNFLLEYDENMTVLAIDNHTILTCDVKGIRFLCSYKLSNLGLDLFAKNYATKYRKATGEIDYTVTRYQDTELTETDWFYMFSDVASQHDAIEGYLTAQGYDRAYKAPITSTGFVRTDCRKASQAVKSWRSQFRKSALSPRQYKMMRQAFMGGITIASYLFSGQTVRAGEECNGRMIEKLGHVDFTSSYPARQMMDSFPHGKPMYYGEIETREEFDTLLSQYHCVFCFRADNVTLRAGVTAPYIPSSKCIEIDKKALKVNGKVIHSETALSMIVTELDWKWICRQYTMDNLEVLDLICFEKAPAPDWLKSRVMDYYEKKCKLKKSDPRLYMASKAKLNAIYGMTATSIVRDEFNMIDDGLIMKADATAEDFDKAVANYYDSYNSFLPYQYGVYTTAYARDALMTMIEAVGYTNFLYCDTDSVFYISTPENEKALASMNDNIKERAKQAGAYVDDNFLGVATPEDELRAFRALHAKCYACEELDEKTGEWNLKVTIAGVPKKSTKWINGNPVTMTNAQELGSIDRLVDGVRFSHNGGTRSVYIESGIERKTINGHAIEYASSCIIENIEKVISDTMFAYGDNYELLNLHMKFD